MAARIFLAIAALVWLPYGIFCFIQPGFLQEAAGVSFTSPTGSTELRAMYGGLQAAVGVLALAGALRTRLSPMALLALAVLCGGLGFARLLGAFIDGSFSGAKKGALPLERRSEARERRSWRSQTRSVFQSPLASQVLRRTRSRSSRRLSTTHSWPMPSTG